jgi:Predicted transcriptional regulators
MSDQKNITPIEQYIIDYVFQLRHTMNLSQEDLANIIGVSRTFIKNIESKKNRAKFNIRHINALADYFGMSPREFLPEKPFPVDIVDKEKPSTKKAAGSKFARKISKRQSTTKKS